MVCVYKNETRCKKCFSKKRQRILSTSMCTFCLQKKILSDLSDWGLHQPKRRWSNRPQKSLFGLCTGLRSVSWHAQVALDNLTTGHRRKTLRRFLLSPYKCYDVFVNKFICKPFCDVSMFFLCVAGFGGQTQINWLLLLLILLIMIITIIIICWLSCDKSRTITRV